MGVCGGLSQHSAGEPRAACSTGEAPTVRLSGLGLAVLCIGLLAGTGCRIEDRTPTGTRRDEDTIHQLLGRYARGLSQRDWADVRSLFWPDGTYSGLIGPGTLSDHRQVVPIDVALDLLEGSLGGVDRRNFDVRILRTDLRQQGDLATAWVFSRRRMPFGSSGLNRDWHEHVVLRRIDGDWRILHVAVVSSPGGEAR